MTAHDADLVVVGAGPAGSAAAIAAARCGRSVILLDRAVFPRDKPCGDLVGARALRAARALGIGEHDVAGYDQLAGATITADEGELALTPTSRIGRAMLANSDARVIPRRVFDAAMVRAAIRAGASLRRIHVRSVERWDGNGRWVRGSAGGQSVELRARSVIIAGGYGCRVAEDVARAPDSRAWERPRGIAMRGYYNSVSTPQQQIVFCLDEWVLPGYGWVFPLPDGSANIGVGMLVGSGPYGQEHLHDLYTRFVDGPSSPIARWMTNAQPVEKPRTWELDLGPRRRWLIANGLLVAGEAAALVGPMTGAGIAFALESGMRAGDIAADALQHGSVTHDCLMPYADWVRRHHLTWLRMESAAHWLISDSGRLRTLLRTVRPLPLTPALGARLLLSLG